MFLVEATSQALPLPPAPVSPLPDLTQLLFDPGHLIALIVGISNELLGNIRSVANQTIEQYVLWTGNFESLRCLAPMFGHGDPTVVQGCRFTDNSVLRHFYGLTSAMANVALVAIVMYSLMRSIWERGYRARYTLKALLPRLLLVVAMVNFGLPLLQGAIDLNNGMVHAFWSFDMGFGIDQPGALWDRMVVPSGLILNSILALLTGILLLILAIVAVARNLMLVFLIGSAPLAFLCLLLPETHTYLTSWRSLFFTTVFTQAGQVMVLRLALVLLFEEHSHNPISVVYGLLALYLVLRVPGALHASSKAESKAMMWAKHGIHAVEKAADHAPHHRVRAHPVADA